MESPRVTSVEQARESLEARGIDLNRSGFRTSGFFITHFALSKGMEVTQLDVDHWVMNQGALRIVDTLVDDIGAECVVDVVSSFTKGETVDGFVNAQEAEVFGELYRAYTPDRLLLQRGILSRWPDLQTIKSNANDITGYIDAIRLESDFYVHTISTLELPDNTDQGQIRSRVNRWMSNMILSGYFVDAAADLEDDVVDGHARIKPSRYNKIRLLGASLAPGLACASQITPSHFGYVATLTERYSS